MITLKAHVADQTGLAEAVRAINTLATDFQRWSKKTEAFSAGVIKEFEMMLEWLAEHVTETPWRKVSWS